MGRMNYSKSVRKALNCAMKECETLRHEFVTPEHLLYALTEQQMFSDAIFDVGCDFSLLFDELVEYLCSMESVPDNVEYQIVSSEQLDEMMAWAMRHAQSAERDTIEVPHIVAAMLLLKDSEARYLIEKVLGESMSDFMRSLVDLYENDDDAASDLDEASANAEPWRNLVTCLSETYTTHTPLIGREAELERTIQVLCRKDKNNPLHVGEPGVGKTALVYGLTAMIEADNVPERLCGARVYMMDMGTMVAGTQFRGDFEKRMKQVMEGLAAEGNVILYIDEIHNLVGAGRSGGDASLDASNMLKPYLESGQIRFIGSTTYEEYNRYIAKNKSFVRRFQQIDIAEPSEEDAVKILNGLKPAYEKFHGVKYSAGTVEYAVRSTARYVADRFLPDKAIDLIDEAGAYRETHPLRQKQQTVGRKLLADILAKMCKIDAAALREEGSNCLATLESDILGEIFGQDKAVSRVVQAVQMAKAGLAEEGKPMASLLFVGPTGVGKTEVAKVLAARLGVRLVRFDMSEYAEKHAVSKLIGAPAGYVGYDDGGLLTDAVRKSPNCVLLFDEIEKAHPDIYNIFLQVMDYASLTDNRGQKADFRNVILIMTSNAGAQYASRAGVGFQGNVSRGEAMLDTVKRTFKPEFINRLTDIVVFNDMNRPMASLILDKTLARLADKLQQRGVQMSVSAEVREHLLDRGFTREYGAREIERVVNAELKPLFMRHILFGELKNGGASEVVMRDGKMDIDIKQQAKPKKKQ